MQSLKIRKFSTHREIVSRTSKDAQNTAMADSLRFSLKERRKRKQAHQTIAVWRSEHAFDNGLRLL